MASNFTRNLPGRRFGKLVVLHHDPDAPDKKKQWVCLCDCGTRFYTRSSRLKNGHVKSCGCLSQVFRARRGMSPVGKHGHSGATKQSRTYISWKRMKSRCNNPNDPAYSKYGGAGIKVCDRWEKFKNFLVDMGERPDNTSIDRIDNYRGYSPDNCRWATRKEQQNNLRCHQKMREDN